MFKPMKKTTACIALISIFLLIGCNKKCDDSKIIQENYLDVNYIPWIIPYQKDSTVYFLKNGFDTVAFTCTNYSHGFETVVLSDEDDGLCGSVKTEFIKTKLYASENGDFFEISYDKNLYQNQHDEVYITYKNGPFFNSYPSDFSPIAKKPFYQKPINGKLYDKVTYALSRFNNDTIMVKYPNSIIKISVGDIYELLDIK
jgi:hypothetical protein